MKFSKLISLLLLANLAYSPLGYSQQPPEPTIPGSGGQPNNGHSGPGHHKKTPPEPHIPGQPPEPNNPNVPPEPHLPNTPPEPHNPDQPPEPHLPPAPPSADMSRVRMVAREQADMMANRVVAIYGEGERELYSFYLGLLEGVNLYNMSTVQRSTDYATGVQRGTMDGRDQGIGAGQRLGEQDGTSQGMSEASGRFTAVIDQNTAPDLRPVHVMPPARNFDPDRPPVKTLEERLSDKNAEFLVLLNRHPYAYEDYSAGTLFDTGTITLLQLYQMGPHFRFNRFVDSYSRADWAWDAWLNRTLGGRYSNALQYFRTISSPDQTSNSSEARRVFIAEFKSQYDSVITYKWQAAVRRVDPVMRNEGLMMGTEIGREYAQDLGYDHGFRSEYTNEAQRSYPSAYQQTYSARFDSTVSYYQSHGVPAEMALSLEPDAGVFVPGSSVSLVIQKLANSGRVDGRFQVSVSSPALQVLTSGTVTVPASRSLRQPVTISQIARVSLNAVPDTDQRVVVDVGGVQSTLTFKVTLAGVVLGLGRTTDNATAALLTDYVRRQLAQEWAAGKTRARLEEVVRVFRSATPTERAGIARSRETWRSADGPQPGLFTGKRGNWKAAQALLDQLR